MKHVQTLTYLLSTIDAKLQLLSSCTKCTQLIAHQTTRGRILPHTKRDLLSECLIQDFDFWSNLS